MVGTYLATLAGLQDSDFFQKAKVNKKKKRRRRRNGADMHFEYNFLPSLGFTL